MSEKPAINYERWAENAVTFIREQGLEKRFKEWSGGWPCPIESSSVRRAAEKVQRIRADLEDFDGDRRGIAAALMEAEEQLVNAVLRDLPLKNVRLCPSCGEPERDDSDITGLHPECPLPPPSIKEG